jgi:hypothetical protein
MISSLRIAGILRDLSRLGNGADLGVAAKKAVTALVREYVEVPHPTFAPGAPVRDVLREIGGHNELSQAVDGMEEAGAVRRA